MESLVALSFAANIVQFVDVATRIITQTARIYRARSSSEPQDGILSLEELTHRITAFAKPLELNKTVNAFLNGSTEVVRQPLARQGTFRNRKKKPGVTITDEDAEALASLDTDRVAKLSECDQEILRTCSGCEEIASNLCSALAKLKGSRATLWSSFAEALRTVWSENKILEVRQRLDQYRQQMTFLLIVSVREKIELAQTKQQTAHVDLFESTKVIRDTLNRIVSEQKAWKSEILLAIQNDHQTLIGDESDETLAAISSQIRPITGESTCFNKSILKWITFSKINSRIDKIAAAHAETFEWIFLQPRDGAWSHFPEWLEEETSDLYWINGKPAAGKSTLLKFMYRDERTTLHLKSWAKETKLIKCAFYFWNSGTSIQMTEAALLRTLLYSALEQAPELCTAVFPSKLEEYIMFGDFSADNTSEEEVRAAFQLLCQGAGSNYRLFLFIDGLDEFGGDHKKLVTTLKNVPSQHVKLCVSSRPWQVFQDAFKKYPSLQLEAMTRDDIKRYVTSRFAESEGYQERRKETLAEIEDLVEQITQKASGVFLWVRLVTDSLLEGLDKGETLGELRDRLESVPVELEGLFERILIDVKSTEHTHISHHFQIMRSTCEPLTLLDFSYADDPATDIVLTASAKSQLTEQAEGRAERMYRRIRTSTKCLLEADTASRKPPALAEVTYLHRTVRDYIERPAIWKEIVAMAHEDFNLPLRMYNMYTIRIKTRPKVQKDESQDFWHNVLHSIDFALQVYPETADIESQTRLLQQLNEVAADHTGIPLHDESSDSTNAGGHWSSTKKGNYMNQSLVHLGIQLQLYDFVAHQLSPGQDAFDLTKKDRSLNIMLLMATLHYNLFAKMPGVSHLSVVHKVPSAELITLLLDKGGDPNYKIDGALLSHGNIPGPYSSWEIHLREPTRSTDNWTDISLIFLKHGANPTVIHDGIPGISPKVLELAQLKSKELRAASSRFNIKAFGVLFRGGRLHRGFSAKISTA